MSAKCKFQKFNSIFDIYPDTNFKGAVVGYYKADGTSLKFPCRLDVSNAKRDKKRRWTASGLGLTPVKLAGGIIFSSASSTCRTLTTNIGELPCPTGL